MTPARRALFWSAVALAFVAVLVLLSDVLLPFVAGMAIAYFLDPLADRVEARGLSRALATTLVLVLFFVLFVAAVLLLVPLLQGQLMGVVRQLPGALQALGGGAMRSLERLSAEIDPEQLEDVRAAVRDTQKALAGWLIGAIEGLFASGLALLNLIGLLVITPVVAWYLLRDWDRLVARVDHWLPRDHAETIREQMREIDRTLAGFVRGQVLVCAILGAAYALALALAGLHYGLVVGLIAGLISFIPYVGSITGLVLGLGLGYLQFGFSIELAIIAAIFLAGQAVEGYYLTPKLVGERVGLHAVWLIFALLAGGSLFGFVGILLAVPVAAVIGVLARFAVASYLDSRLYRGDRGESA
jgi:predicted PurR-regulated permease PerM